ncbi:hypothetical protein NL676_024241 [Syzygium grande]|nr:hypothetical protein NL676_024241 [Syzygium grande]
MTRPPDKCPWSRGIDPFILQENSQYTLSLSFSTASASALSREPAVAQGSDLHPRGRPRRCELGSASARRLPKSPSGLFGSRAPPPPPELGSALKREASVALGARLRWLSPPKCPSVVGSLDSEPLRGARSAPKRESPFSLRARICVGASPPQEPLRRGALDHCSVSGFLYY